MDGRAWRRPGRRAGGGAVSKAPSAAAFMAATFHIGNPRSNDGSTTPVPGVLTEVLKGALGAAVPPAGLLGYLASQLGRQSRALP
jgi:hypothetical protein